jgi:hypothetical protein
MLQPHARKTYVEFYSRDNALVQGPEDLPDGATEDDVERHERELKERVEKLKRCRETGDWRELAIEGLTPTKFTLRFLTGDQMRKLNTMVVHREIHDAELQQLAFRCAVVGIENAGGIKIEHQQHPKLGTVLHVNVTNAFDALDPDIVNELGGLALERGTGDGSPHR